jgi:hypothetical protein
MNPRPHQTADVHTERRQPGRRLGLTVTGQRRATVVGGALAVTSGWTHRHQLGAGFDLLDHLSWRRLVVGRVVEGASLAPVGLLQRRLLRAGDVNISAVDMTKISVAANAISVSLPAGGAWSATWSWREFRRQGRRPRPGRLGRGRCRPRVVLRPLDPRSRWSRAGGQSRTGGVAALAGPAPAQASRPGDSCCSWRPGPGVVANHTQAAAWPGSSTGRGSFASTRAHW